MKKTVKIQRLPTLARGKDTENKKKIVTQLSFVNDMRGNGAGAKKGYL
jgi:hypothetical protein